MIIIYNILTFIYNYLENDGILPLTASSVFYFTAIKSKVRIIINSIDFSITTSEQIEEFLCGQLKKIRLTRNFTQTQLAKESGVAIGTIRRLEEGQTVSVNTFIRVLIALDLQQNLETLLPDPTIRPIERVNTGGSERKRARPVKSDFENSTWAWGDESGDKK